MKKTIFHGSSRKFDAFIIDPALTITNETALMEGVGIYLTDNKEFAKSIGAYTYAVEVDESDITDMTSDKVIRSIIRKTLNAVDKTLLSYINIDLLSSCVKSGQISVVNLFKEIESTLDSSASFYESFGEQVTYEDDCFFKKIEDAYFNSVANVLKYYDSSYKHDNYICFRNVECLTIVEIVEEV